VKDIKVKLSKDFTPEEHRKSLQLFEDQEYLKALQEIEGDKDTQRRIVEGGETPGNFLGFRGLSPQRYYQDLATRMQDLRTEHTNAMYNIYAEDVGGVTWGKSPDDWLNDFLQGFHK
jgi:hypothetical protein